MGLACYFRLALQCVLYNAFHRCYQLRPNFCCFLSLCSLIASMILVMHFYYWSSVWTSLRHPLFAVWDCSRLGAAAIAVFPPVLSTHSCSRVLLTMNYVWNTVIPCLLNAHLLFFLWPSLHSSFPAGRASLDDGCTQFLYVVFQERKKKEKNEVSQWTIQKFSASQRSCVRVRVLLCHALVSKCVLLPIALCQWTSSWPSHSITWLRYGRIYNIPLGFILTPLVTDPERLVGTIWVTLVTGILYVENTQRGL